MKHIPINTKYLISENGLILINEVSGRRLIIGDQQVKGKITGYKYASLIFDENEYKIKRIAVHRLVAMTYLEPPKQDQVWVNHKDGNKSNNHYLNLEWTTISENIQHAVDTGLISRPRGEDHWLYGKKATVKSRAAQSLAKIGDKHPRFKGYYVCNWVQYGSAIQAGKALAMNNKTVANKCKSGKYRKDGWYFLPKLPLFPD